MINLFWHLVAKLLARPALADWIITRAQRTPYLHIMSADSAEMYMGRWWLFNPYSRTTHKPSLWWWPWSFRIHHIMRPDEDRDPHDHPWNARTIILRGWYREQRLLKHDGPVPLSRTLPDGYQATEYIDRQPGDTARLRHGEYHRIDQVAPAVSSPSSSPASGAVTGDFWSTASRSLGAPTQARTIEAVQSE